MLRLYAWVDDILFGRPDDPQRAVDLGQLLDGLTAGERPGPEALDVVIRFDGADEPIEGWPSPRFGAWTLLQSGTLPLADRSPSLGLPPGGLEMLLGHPVVVSRLIARAGPERRVIGQVVSRVDPLSMRRSARGHLSGLPGLIARTVSAVRRDGEAPRWVNEPAIDDVALTNGPLGSGAVIVSLVRVLGGYFVRLGARRLVPERWAVAVSWDRDDPRDHGGSFRFLRAPDGREWADPFPVRTGDADFVFLEEYVHAAHRGRLAVVELDGRARGWRSVETILELPTHLSYPFVFEWAGAWYLLPEQAATGALQLYVADAFPTSWRWHSTALDLPAADATIAEIDGRWWMFAAFAGPGALAADELHLFHAATPLGPWTAHRGNPVVCDVRSARPAGRIRQRDGVWYRVAQDGAVTYGHSITIIRIDRLDLDGYAETVVDVIRPEWAPGLAGTHTINSDRGLTAVDARRTRPRVRR